MRVVPKQEFNQHDIVPATATNNGGLNMTDPSTVAGLKFLYGILDKTAGEVDEVLPLRTFAVFVTIALHEGESNGELGQRLGMSQSALSRHIANLGDLHFKKTKPGYKLISVEKDTMDAKKNKSYLTKKGQSLVGSLTYLIGRFKNPS